LPLQVLVYRIRQAHGFAPIGAQADSPVFLYVQPFGKGYLGVHLEVKGFKY